MRTVETRADLGNLCNELNFQRAIEIGTHQGVFADQFLSLFKGHLTCVDPWIGRPPEGGDFQPCFVPGSPDREFDEALARFVLSMKYGPRVSIHKMKSLEFAETLEDRSIDFIYIDGLHDIASVKADVLAFWPKIKPGGILAGHDYIYGTADPTLCGVTIAVNWFAVEHSLDLQITRESLPASWFFRKP